MTGLLLPHIVRQPFARVINVSSGGGLTGCFEQIIL
jgi:short-subunit dehydrogenase involved in D-alanine esterification of teichoic acids